MRATVLSVLSRLSAGALLLQAGIPAAATLLPLPASTPPKLGRPSLPMELRVRPAPHGPVLKDRLVPLRPGTRAVPAPPSPTLLDDRAYLRSPITGYDAERWRGELRTRPETGREARLRIQVGEFELGRSEPVRAERYFHEAERLLPETSRDRGLAAYDAALSLFLQGRFPEARHAFRALYASPLSGFDRKNAALYARHASACAGYHAAHKALGIPQPTRLDPLCGATSLAVALRELRMPYDEKTVLPAVRRTGEGSSFDDLLDAMPRLGLTGRAVTMDRKGLLANAAPLVAHVERDHFVAVTRADRTGVTYYCSDCGCWPGGKVHVTWRQWDAMDADAYLMVTRTGSPAATALAHLPTRLGESPARLRLAERGYGSLAAVAAAQRTLTAMAGHVALLSPGNPYNHTISTICGMRGMSLQCFLESCPLFWCQKCMEHASFEGDPVNLATGAEEYAPAPDLTVYNPKGPSVVWTRTYGSLANTTPCGFGSGWSHTYNWRILTTGSSPALVTSNGATLAITNLGGTPTSGSPASASSFGPGVPMKVERDYSPSSATSYVFKVTFKDQSQWTFTPNAGGDGGPINQFYPTKIQDRFGNAIVLSWMYFISSKFTPDPVSGLPAATILRKITNPDGDLLQIQLDADLSIAHVIAMPPLGKTDGRAVNYRVEQRLSANVPSGSPQYQYELTRVSFRKPVSSDAQGYLTYDATIASAGERYSYEYEAQNNGETSSLGMEKVPYLKYISVPDPSFVTAAGTWDNQHFSTTTLTTGSDGSVASLTDGNGNVTTFSPVVDMGGNATATKVVTRVGANGSVSRAYYARFGETNNLSLTRNDLIVTAVSPLGGEPTVTPMVASYAAPNDIYSPHTVQDGNGKTWTMEHDAYGNLTKVTTPKGTPTTTTYDPSFFGQPSTVKVGASGSLLSTTTMTYAPGTGALSSIDSPVPYRTGVAAGSTQTTTIDQYTALGNPGRVRSPGNATSSLIPTTMGYGGDAYTERLGLPTSVTDAAGHYDWTGYDRLGNAVETLDRDGNQTDYDYGTSNELLYVLAPTSGQTYAPNNATGRMGTQYVYVYPGGPLSYVLTYAENSGGNPCARTDFFYGHEGELKVKQGVGEYEAYDYDASYRVVAVHEGTPGNKTGAGTTIKYDLAGRVTRVKEPTATSDSGPYTHNYTYDATNNLKTELDGRGVQKTYEYTDGDGLLSAVKYTTGGTPMMLTATGAYYVPTGMGTPAVRASTGAGYDASFTYDLYGRLLTQSDPTQSVTYTYGDLGEVKTEAQNYASHLKTFAYDYNPDGSRLRMGVDGYAWDYQYDTLGRFWRMDVTSGGATLATTYANHTAGDFLRSRAYPFGYAYFQTKLDAQAPGRGILDGVYNETNAGAVYSQFTGMAYNAQLALGGYAAAVPSSSALTGAVAYGYSTPTGGTPFALTSESAPQVGGLYQHGYDGGLNLTTLRGNAQPSAGANDVPTGSGAPAYDGAGNYAAGGAAHDGEDHMVLLPGGGAADYRPDGQRSWVAFGSSFRRFYGDLDGAPVLETDAAGNVTAVNVFDEEGLAARVEGGATHYYLFDAQGSVASEVDASGSLVNSRFYDAYGWEAQVRNAAGASVSTTSPWGWNARWGYYADRASGTYHLGAREYSPGMGRFLERDPIGFAGGMNPYAYCAGDPVGRSAPSIPVRICRKSSPATLKVPWGGRR